MLSNSLPLVLLSLGSLVSGKLLSGHYEVKDRVDVRVSNVAPFDNPTEVYSYDRLPWPCKPKHPHTGKQSFGGFLHGERNRASLYHIEFLTPTQNKQSVCGSATISKHDTREFIHAIDQEYQYEMWIDDLPVWGRVGFSQEDESTDHKLQHFLITHRHFHLKYHDDQIISVNISTRLEPGHYVPITAGQETENVQFTYSVTWSKTKVSYADRWEYHMQANPSRYQVEAHWLWILNSSLLVVLLTGLLSMILLRTLKNDVARYLQVDQIDQEEMMEARTQGLLEEVDDSGWKRIRSDVFRPPPYPYLLSSIVGVGAQILLIVLFMLVLAVIGYFYPGNHGRIYVAALFLYSFTSYVSGYLASTKLKELARESHDWMISCGLTASLYAGPFLLTFSIINSVSVYWEASSALPFPTIVAIVLLWAFVTFPLTAFGAYRGGKAKDVKYPCRVNKIARNLPQDLPWYHNQILLVVTAGFLPFMAIYVEVHTIFMSVWGHQPYTLFGVLLLTFVILLIVTSFIVILMCYFQLTAEDYRWWWSSIFRGGACGLFMQAYAIYYYTYSSHMTGGLQFTMYFGYTLMISYGFCLMLAAVGHWSSRWFVVKIYEAIKAD